MSAIEPVQAASPSFSVGGAIGFGWRKTWKNFWRLLLVVIVFTVITTIVGSIGGVGVDPTFDMSNPDTFTADQVFNAGNEVLFLVGAVLQVLVRALECGLPLEDAIAAPRLHQQHSPSHSLFEQGFDPALLEELRATFGHELKPAAGHLALVGAIHLDAPGAKPSAVHDPRRTGLGATTKR